MRNRLQYSRAFRHWAAFVFAASPILITVLIAALIARSLTSSMQPWLAGAGSGAWYGPLYGQDGMLVDTVGREVHLAGVNWFGFETQSFAPHGLDVRNYQSMLDQIAGLGFNTIRLPYSNQLFDPSSQPTDINYDLNPDLRGLRGLALMDKFVAAAGRRGLKIILDRHRPDAYAQSDLWYTAQVPESRWIADWVMLARHYRGNYTVIGADLANEPHGPATWGDGNLGTDWRLAAERAGNAILAANPDWLIIVQGIERYGNDWYWWGGNLLGARQHPVRLS
jgi:endoglucanase